MPLPFDGILRDFGDGSSGAYLSPPKNGNHASSLELLHDGSLAVTWFSGGEGQPGCGIAFSVLPPLGDCFTPGRLVSVRPTYSNQNPVLYSDATALPPLLHLFHTSQATGPGGGENTSTLFHLQSNDGGVTFSPPTQFYSAPGAFLRGSVVTLSGGGVLLPAYMSIQGTDYSIMLQGSNASSGGEGSWVPHTLPMSGDLIQPSVVRLGPGKGAALKAFLRDEDAIAIYTATSVDEGLSWSLPSRTPLPSNNAGIAARVLSSGALAMVFNDHPGTELPRAPLVLALSTDQGETWPCFRVLQAHDSNSSSSVGEYSYPSLIQDAQGSLWVSYTYDRLTILVRKVTEAWVREAC